MNAGIREYKLRNRKYGHYPADELGLELEIGFIILFFYFFYIIIIHYYYIINYDGVFLFLVLLVVVFKKKKKKDRKTCTPMSGAAAGITPSPTS